MFRSLAVWIGLLLIPNIALAAEPTTVSLPLLALETGQSDIIEAQINCLADGCSAFDITIHFEPGVLQVDGVEIGPYLGDQVFTAENRIDNAAGIVTLAATALGDPPPDAESVLLRLQVTALAAGVSQLRIAQLDVGDMVGNPLETVGVDGGVMVSDSPTSTGSEANHAEAVPQADVVTEPEVEAPQAAQSEANQPLCQYEVRTGDTLSGIALANHVSVDQIAEMNGIADARTIRVGQVLNVPASECRAAATSGNIIEVHDCRHLGNNVFEWYSVRRTYDASGNPVSETRIGGPYSGEWRPGCPAGEPPPRPSRRSGGGSGDTDGSSPPSDDDDGGGGTGPSICELNPSLCSGPPINESPPVIGF